MSRYEITRAGVRRPLSPTPAGPIRPKGAASTNAKADDWKQRSGFYWRKPRLRPDRRPSRRLHRLGTMREDYAAWLARKTGRPYRLATEAEWEYARTRRHHHGPLLGRRGGGRLQVPPRSSPVARWSSSVRLKA